MRRLGNWLLVLAIIGAAVGAVLPFATPQSVMAMTGSGTSGDPWIIMDVDDLQAIGTGSYALNHYYELGGDIDASATATWNWDAGRSVYAGFAPIGTFTGNFNGNYRTISGLYINADTVAGTINRVGLFSRVTGSTAIVQNVLFVGADVSGVQVGTADGGTCEVGILAGFIDMGGRAERVLVHGVVNSHVIRELGGLTTPIGHAAAGGVVGMLGASGTSGYLVQCASYANTSATMTGRRTYALAGGLAGKLYGGYVYDSFARGNAAAVIIDTTTPAYGAHAGGLIGQMNYTSIYRSYSTGTATASGTDGSTSGGFGGRATTNVYAYASFFDKQTSGHLLAWGHWYSPTGYDEVQAKTTLQMKTQSTFTGAGWDFATVWSMNTYVNDGYPYLLWWYDPADPVELTADIYQVVHFQPNTIISGTTLPNLAQGGGVHPNGTFTWGSNPAGIDIRGPEDFGPEDPYYESVTPGTWDIIEPEPTGIVGGIDLDRLADNPMSPFVQVLSSSDLITERLAWLLLAIFIVIAAMVATQLLGQHMVFTSLVGFGLTALFYSMGVWGMWVVILMAFGLVASIVYERMPTL
jgi:hypothetical protein